VLRQVVVWPAARPRPVSARRSLYSCARCGVRSGGGLVHGMGVPRRSYLTLPPAPTPPLHLQCQAGACLPCQAFPSAPNARRARLEPVALSGARLCPPPAAHPDVAAPPHPGRARLMWMPLQRSWTAPPRSPLLAAQGQPSSCALSA